MVEHGLALRTQDYKFQVFPSNIYQMTSLANPARFRQFNIQECLQSLPSSVTVTVTAMSFLPCLVSFRLWKEGLKLFGLEVKFPYSTSGLGYLSLSVSLSLSLFLSLSLSPPKPQPWCPCLSDGTNSCPYLMGLRLNELVSIQCLELCA